MDTRRASEIGNRQDIIEVFKIYRGYSSVALNKLFVIDTNNKVTTEVTLVSLKGQVHRGYCAVFFRLELLTDGMSWIRLRWMHLASLPLKSHREGQEQTDWLLYGLVH